MEGRRRACLVWSRLETNVSAVSQGLYGDQFNKTRVKKVVESIYDRRFFENKLLSYKVNFWFPFCSVHVYNPDTSV